MNVTESFNGLSNQKTEKIETSKDFEVFFKEHYPLFLSFACRYLDEEEARDIVQDVFTTFWEKRTDFHSLISIKAFFYRSIANGCLNFLRHEKVKQNYADINLTEMQSEESIKENIIREETQFILYKKLKELTAREREIIMLSLQNKSNAEIAEILSISLPTVKTHKMHAYQRLRVALEDLRFLLIIF